MIKYSRFSLDNGLRILVHEDKSTPLVAMNVLYNVGSRDEEPTATGLAHLFEHLMFGGSVNIPDFDSPMQMAGGENNAFTNNDITNYYLTLPAANIETGFWLESDRMLGLDFSQRNLDIQKKVVIEEFNQRYLNQPYGDSILMLRPLAYKIHSYRWPTIGMDISHIQYCNLEQVKEFFFSHYAPNNAILSLTGNINPETAYSLAQKWFGPIEKRKIKLRNLTAEPLQTEERKMTVEKKVPASAIYKAWHTSPRKSKDFYAMDLITDLLAGGESGRLYNILVKEKKLFSEINAYITSDIDPGLILIHGRVMKGVDIHKADENINSIISELKEKIPEIQEMDKVKNKYESTMVFSNTSILNKAANLAFYELLDDAEMINNEVERFREIDTDGVIETSRKYLVDSNCSTLYYKSSHEKN
jgi:predicted Zn-dependent peptidase